MELLAPILLRKLSRLISEEIVFWEHLVGRVGSVIACFRAKSGR